MSNAPRERTALMNFIVEMKCVQCDVVGAKKNTMKNEQVEVDWTHVHKTVRVHVEVSTWKFALESGSQIQGFVFLFLVVVKCYDKLDHDGQSTVL